MDLTRHTSIPGLIIRRDQIKTIDVIFGEQVFPARTIKPKKDVPAWLTDYKATGPSRYMDVTWELIMVDQSLQDAIENIGLSKIYADAIITTNFGGRAAIKDASIIHCFDLDVTLIGGIFVLKEDVERLKVKKTDEDQTLNRFQMIDLED